MIGKTISHYKILEKLGEGGMGVVYKAEDTRLKRTVALKFLPPELTRDEETKNRFIHEAQAASSIEHNNICTIHEIDETEDRQTFITMACYEGETLKEKIKDERLKIKEVVDIAIQIAQGLTKAHEKGIIHRDIKPSNIFITTDGIAKIIDFGLAKLAGQTILTKEGSTLGTVNYMSPEQTRGEGVDYRTDIWSLGVVLYEMISGRTPFKGDYDQAVVYSIINEEPEPLTALRSGVPMELERLVNKALAKNPDERFQHADEILSELKIVRKKLEKPAKAEPSKIVPEEHRKKRFKRIATLSVILISLILGFFLVRFLFFEEVLVSEPKPIAVISFENQTGDKAYDYLQKAIPNLLITNLEQSKYLRVTTWERMHDLLKQLGKQDMEIINKDLGFELCRMDGIDAIVLGSFTKVGNMFATDVKVLDVTTKQILKSANSKGKGEDSILETQIDDLSRDIARGVGISERKIEETPQRIADVTTTSLDAYNYFLRGREDWEKFYFNDAKQFLEKAVTLDTTFAAAYLYLAFTCESQANYKASTKAWEKAKAFSNRASEKERQYIEAFYAADVEKNPEKCIRILEQMLKKYPKEKRIHQALAYYYDHKHLYSQAIEESNIALQLDPNYGPALNQLAYTYVAMDDFEKAIEYLKRYASVSPGDANPFDSMADIYFRMGKLSEAMVKYQEALTVRPDFFISIWKIGYIYALMEIYPQAMKWNDRYIDIPTPSSKIISGYMWKGIYYYWLGKIQQTFAELNKAMDLWKAAGFELGSATIDWSKAWIYLDMGELNSGRRCFKNWFDFNIEYDPYHKPFYIAESNFYHGLLELKEGQIDSAKLRLAEIKSRLTEIDATHENHVSIFYNILHSEIMLAEDSLEKAITAARRAESLLKIPAMEALNMVYYYNLPYLKDVIARAYQKKGKLNEAIAEYERLITFDPGSKDRRLIHPKSHYRLAKLYQEKGWLSKAIEQYEGFLDIWKDADEDLPELMDAKNSLAKLTEQE